MSIAAPAAPDKGGTVYHPLSDRLIISIRQATRAKDSTVLFSDTLALSRAVERAVLVGVRRAMLNGALLHTARFTLLRPEVLRSIETAVADSMTEAQR